MNYCPFNSSPRKVTRKAAINPFYKRLDELDNFYDHSTSYIYWPDSELIFFIKNRSS
jgi:hypothetical protein